MRLSGMGHGSEPNAGQACFVCVLLTVVFCIGFVNAINMADGANGLMHVLRVIQFLKLSPVKENVTTITRLIII